MDKLNFYEIKSKKSEEFVNGVRQVSLVNADCPDIYCFIWFNREEEIEHIQFIYHETIIEWFATRGLVLGQTNRQFDPMDGKTGWQKGVRTIHQVEDDSEYTEGLDMLHQAIFPEAYRDHIQEKMRP